MKLVFVSSTFRDMQFERDALHTRVVPRMNQFLERYSETVHFGDLRWGVNTTELESEESSKKVLKVCLDQIEDCKPYMIVFIGERYGWIPSADLLHGAALLKGMDTSAIKENTSVTELEIEYGALLNPDLEGRVLFYFRNPFDMSQMTEAQRADYIAESPLHRERVEQLKAQIEETYPDYIRHYDVAYDAESQQLVGLEPLMDRIFEDLQRVFDLDLAYLNALPAEERGLANSKNHFEKMAADSYYRDLSAVNEFDYDAFSHFYQARFENNPVLEVVTGPHGIGAKTLVAQKYSNIVAAGYNAACFSFGMDEFTDTVDKMVSAFCYRLEEWMEIPHGTKATADRFADLCEEYTHRSELPYLYFFAVNLPQSALKVLYKLSARYPYLFGVGFCLHFRKEISDQASLPFFLKSRITRVPALGAEEIEEMVRAILRAKRKELPKIVIDEIKKHSEANLPLYLSLLVERLLILDSEDFAAIRARGDGMDQINAYMIDLIRQSGDNVTEIAKELLEELAERINPVMIRHLVAHIALPYHYGEDGIQEFFTHQGWSYTSLDFTLFKKTFPSLVYQNAAGYLYYTNNDVKAAAQQLSEKWGTDRDVQAMMTFMDTKPTKQVIKAKLLTYRYLGDAGRFADCVLACMDGTVYREETKTLAERCHDAFCSIMQEEIAENSDFAVSVSEAMLDAIAKGQVKYPYEMASYVLQCIPSCYVVEKEAVDGTYAFLVQLERRLSELRERCEEEVLKFTHFLVCGSYMMPLLVRMGGLKASAEGKRVAEQMRSAGPHWPQRVLQIIWERKLPLVKELSDGSTEMFRMFSDVLRMDDPVKEPMFRGLYEQCVRLEEYLSTKEADRYACLMKGDIETLPQSAFDMYALFLAMWGFCCDKIGDVSKARRCYDAFYALFAGHFQANPPDAKDRSMYIGAIKGYCRFLIAHEKKKKASARFEELFEWCLARMAEPPLDFETAYELMQMQQMGLEHDCLEDGTKAFFPIFGQLLSAASATIVAPQTALRTVEYYAIFSSLLSDEERERYFAELVSRMVRGTASLLSEGEFGPLEVIDLLCQCIVDFGLTAEVDIGGLAEAVISRIVDEHPDVFEAEGQEYVAAGMRLCVEILKERKS
ncbi:MAG: DUF4062 domain-containing protein [Ruminococcaceae bacterium]|nr:DUF4062 domain-containing protein [Oscillospiraceae bacterium]